MTFTYPWVLGLVVVVVAAYVVWVLGMARGRRRVRALSRDPVARPRYLAAGLLAVAGVLAIVAAAGPRWGTQDSLIPRTGAQLVVVLDTSRSMAVADVAPNRLAAAKAGLVATFDRLGGDRVGLVIFAGDARVRFPLTTDLNAASRVVESVEIGQVLVAPGSSAASGLDLGLDAFDEGQEAGRFAPGATHAPHHVPKEWADKYKGKFDQGWDKLREETIARQKQLGVIPADCQLTARHKEIPAWDEMPEAFKTFVRHEMEVYAGFMEYTDYHVGRMLDGLKKLGIFDDTLVYYIIGDNGASAEGGINGCFNEMSYFNGLQALETPEYLSARLDKLGGPESYNHYAVGWAHAMNTPYQWTKQVASHWGGTRNGTIISWPKGIKAKGEIRSQFHHVIDVAPTILEAAGLPEPVSVNGVQQEQLEGVSMLYSLNDAKAAERHETQYFEMFGNRGIYHKGWTAVTKHRTPWASLTAKPPAFDDDVWELYEPGDWSQANDVSKTNPQKLHDLQRLWLIEATRYKVLPLDDRMMEKMNPDTAGRPVLIKGKTQILFGGMGRLSENCVLSIKNKSHSVTAEIEAPEKGAEGVIISQGANIGGWSLYAKNGKLKYCYNWGGFKHFMVESAAPIPAGAHQVRMEFAYAGGGLGKGGKATLYIDGKKVGEGDIDATLAIVFSADDGCDVGEDSGAPVSPDYGPQGNAFNGRVKGVQLSIVDAPENSDHLVKPEDAIRVAMARQ